LCSYTISDSHNRILEPFVFSSDTVDNHCLIVHSVLDSIRQTIRVKLSSNRVVLEWILPESDKTCGFVCVCVCSVVECVYSTAEVSVRE